jgi:hypothetical protein
LAGIPAKAIFRATVERNSPTFDLQRTRVPLCSGQEKDSRHERQPGIPLPLSLGQAIAQTMAYAEDTSRGPFGRLGWFPDLQRWVQDQIGTQGLHLNGRFRQLNACPTFSLIRFETDGPAV